VWRDGAGVEVLVTPRAIAAAERVMPSELGLTLRRASRGSVVAQVAPLSVAEQAGLQAGDLIAWAGAAQAPPPEAVLRAYAAQASGSALLVGVERGGQPLVVALPHP
jgi:S1-C subfamily serine protease